jgi:hypothetical protein
MDPKAGLDDVEKRKFLTLPGLELRPFSRPARSQSQHRLRYPGSWRQSKSKRKCGEVAGPPVCTRWLLASSPASLTSATRRHCFVRFIKKCFRGQQIPQKFSNAWGNQVIAHGGSGHDRRSLLVYRAVFFVMYNLRFSHKLLWRLLFLWYNTIQIEWSSQGGWDGQGM